jgi:GT2 family glycosyltransferase
VCHRSSEALPECLSSFRRQAAATGVDAEVVAVEHSEEQEEARRVAEAGVDRVLERPNLGYAAGLNAGVAVAGGEILLLANPDIRFFEGSLEHLLAGLDQGFDVVGPQFVWDSDGEILMPPAEDPALPSEIGRGLRRRWKWYWTRSVSKDLEDLWHVWTAERTLPVKNLRGALLALRAETMDRLGPLDEGYFLYYEETEWLWQARRRGARLGLAAGALVQHRWGHSTSSTGGAVGIERQSRERFLERNYLPMSRWLLRAASGRDQQAPIVVAELDDCEEIPEVEADLWLASPGPHLMPALGCARSTGMPQPFVDFCRAWKWVVVAVVRDRARWRISGAWAWGG